MCARARVRAFACHAHAYVPSRATRTRVLASNYLSNPFCTLFPAIPFNQPSPFDFAPAARTSRALS
eukprot:5765055-Pleurochrysis_carterae.AAC.1